MKAVPYQIEITNKCTNQCSYCPRSSMKRPIGIMSLNTLHRIAAWVEDVRPKAVNLHHFGESLCAPSRTIEACKLLSPYTKCRLTTNGVLLNLNLVDTFFEAGLQELSVTVHNENVDIVLGNLHSIPLDFRKKISILLVEPNKDLLPRIPEGYSVYLKRLRDLGFRRHYLPFVTHTSFNETCSFLINHEVAVLWDGTIVRCCECYDLRQEWVLGSVNSDKFWENIPNIPIPECAICSGYGNWEEETELTLLRGGG